MATLTLSSNVSSLRASETFNLSATLDNSGGSSSITRTITYHCTGIEELASHSMRVAKNLSSTHIYYNVAITDPTATTVSVYATGSGGEISNTVTLTIIQDILVEKPEFRETPMIKEYSSSGREIDEADFTSFDYTAYYLTCSTYTTPGAYTCTVTCNSGYRFTDSSTVATYNWEIHNTNVSKPTLTQTSTDYTGGYQSVESSWFSGWSEWVTLSCTPQINHSDTPYTCSVSLNNAYCYWSGGGRDTQTYNWTINKIDQSISFSPASATIEIGESVQSYLQGTSFGSYNQPTGQTHTTATYNLGVISVTGVTAGDDELTVTFSGDMNHNAASISFYVTVNQPAPTQWSKIKIRVNGSWHHAIPHIYSGGRWHKAKIVYRNNNSWIDLNN